MNLKQAKRIRRGIVQALAAGGIEGANVYDRKLNLHTVPSRRYNLTNTETGEVTKGRALQWRLDPLCPRGIYRRVKGRVQAARRAERSRVLREFRDSFGRGAVGAVEHTGTARIQPDNEAMPRVQGMGLQNSA